MVDFPGQQHHNPIRQIIQDIHRVFKDQRYPNNIDLVRLRDYMDKDKTIKQDNLFKKRLNSLQGQNTIRRDQFENLLNLNLGNEEHFKLVFTEIDKNGSGAISKKELKEYCEQLGMGLTENDYEIMINYASRDKLKVNRDDLFKFINS